MLRIKLHDNTVTEALQNLTEDILSDILLMEDVSVSVKSKTRDNGNTKVELLVKHKDKTYKMSNESKEGYYVVLRELAKKMESELHEHYKKKTDKRIKKYRRKIQKINDEIEMEEDFEYEE